MEDNRKNRKTLKSYFQFDKVPSEEQFAELIDSVSNFVEDGVLKCGKKGWRVCPLQGGKPGVGFYLRETDDESIQPVWLLTVSSDKELLLENEKGERVLSISQDMTVRLLGDLSVEGKIIGHSPGDNPENIRQIEIVADKKWHNLPVEAEIDETRPGCRVYSIWTCYQDAVMEDYGVTEAVAQNFNFQTLKVKSSRKHWWGWTGAVRLRWKKSDGGKLYLQIRSTYKGPRRELHCRIKEIGNYTEK